MFRNKALMFIFLIIIVFMAGIVLFPDFKLQAEALLAHQSKTEIILMVVLALAIIIVLFNRRENMDNINKIGSGPDRINCHSGFEFPNRRDFNASEEDLLSSDVNYAYNIPGYYLENNGRFCQNGVKYDRVADIMCSSKFHHLYDQQNFNIIMSPHTHIGKARGYLNWDKIYD